jgi:glutamine amidotransferase
VIVIIDYGMGNLRSVARALEVAGAEDLKVSSSVKEILRSDKIVLPGVGAMGEAMRQLKKGGLVDIIKENIFKKPFFGICLGMQLLFSESEEGGKVKGFNIFKGRVKRFSDKLKVPHIGWNNIKVTRSQGHEVTCEECPILKDIPDNSYFYFCHSYYAAPADKSIIAATANYGKEFVCAVCKDNLFACQFHPEKSQELGLRLLKNFVRL